MFIHMSLILSLQHATTDSQSSSSCQNAELLEYETMTLRNAVARAAGWWWWWFRCHDVGARHVVTVAGTAFQANGLVDATKSIATCDTWKPIRMPVPPTLSSISSFPIAIWYRVVIMVEMVVRAPPPPRLLRRFDPTF